MTKQEILTIIETARRNNPTFQWSTAFGLLTKSNDSTVLEGLARYIKACQKQDIELEANTFIEILEDAKREIYVWQNRNNDLASLTSRRNGGVRGGSYRNRIAMEAKQ